MYNSKNIIRLNTNDVTAPMVRINGRNPINISSGTSFVDLGANWTDDMDGTGNQLNISTRGLDPHRGWEFNNRKDGIITNSDMYGYPASHYNIPMEAVERIELVRGTGSLQYGAQFGGMLNYISKQPDPTKKITFESINTLGSYGLVSTYNGVSGKISKYRYSAWINRKWITGYRDNSDAKYNAEGVSLFYDATKNLHFIDFQNQSQMPVAYRLGDVLVLPSKGPVETWGLSVNEAMACSRTIIVSNRCGCGIDLVKDNINGFIFRRTNLKALVSKTKYLLNNKNRLPEMGKASLQIIKQWSFIKICEQIEKVVLHDIFVSK